MTVKGAVLRLVVVAAFAVCQIGAPTGAAAIRASAGVAADTTTIQHILNRLGYGPRRGDIERVREMSVPRYVDLQLHPDRVADAAMEARLGGLPTIAMSSREIAERYAIPALQERRAQRRMAEQESGHGGGDPMRPDLARRQANLPIKELAAQKLLRAAYSERQLQEVLADFWFNHFNVDARKGPDRFLLTEYERDVIRPRVLGRFRDLVGAVAKSPAMLFYLDNWMSSATRGLNENYARELLELHTLGVDGGYSQRDVTDVARAFTGWSIDRPREGGGFRFAPRLHDAGRKQILGHVIRAGGGEEDGEQVLDILARHPSTARFIATKLARRFVSDTPPAALVDRLAERFRATDGDLRDVMRTLLESPEFLAPGAVGVKTKTPLEFVVSAVRATGAEIGDATPLVRTLERLGMPLYMCQPPTGYQDTAAAWMNAGGLVGRINFALMISRQAPAGLLDSPADSPKSLALELGSPEFQRK